MSTTDAKESKSSGTLAHRFTTHLEAVTSPSDIAVLVRSFELSLRTATCPSKPAPGPLIATRSGRWRW